MPRARYYKERDCRFDDWRRNDVLKGLSAPINLPLYSTDIDGLEYSFDQDPVGLLALIEKKREGGKWRKEWPTSMIAQHLLASLANIPYYIAEHTVNCSRWTVYHVTTTQRLVNENDICLSGTLYDYVLFLCRLHHYEPPDIFKEGLRRVIAISKDGQSILRSKRDCHIDVEYIKGL